MKARFHDILNFEEIRRHFPIIARLTRYPHICDKEVLAEMQRLMVMSSTAFKEKENVRQICRVIGVHYLFRKRLRAAIETNPEKRHLFLKLYRSQLHLGIIVGVNLLKENELFEKRHLLAAIQNYIPTAQALEDFFICNHHGKEDICLLYLEINKSTGDPFSTQEVKTLLKELPIDLKDRIEQLMPPIFMPRNEEEIVRNVLSLSNQIKFVRDIPQVTITFDEQTPSSLIFTVILVRVLRPHSWSIQDLFKYAKTFLHYIHDRTRSLGFLRKKYLKEATVFRLKIPKDKFLRRDHSIDFNKARQAVFNELTRILGDLRDYNGGMISKQNELLNRLQEMLGDRAKFNELLLESFFYSLTPVVMRTVMDPRALKILFLMSIEALEKAFFTGEDYALRIKNDTEFVYVMIKTLDLRVKDELTGVFNKLQIPASDLANTHIKVYDAVYIGYIYRCDDADKQRKFCYALQNVLQAWEHKKLATKFQRQV